MKEQDLPAEVDDLRAVLRRHDECVGARAAVQRALAPPGTAPPGVDGAPACMAVAGLGDEPLEAEGEVLSAYPHLPADATGSGAPPPADGDRA